MTPPLICPTGKSAISLSSLFRKNHCCGRAKPMVSLLISDFPKLCLTAKSKQPYCDFVPPPLEGRFAIVTDVGGGMRGR
jgi:hypothetical protein